MSNGFQEMLQNFINFLKRIFGSPAFKFILIGALLIALVVPLFIVQALNSERKRYERQAQYDVGSKWGQTQYVRGPYLVVPTIKRQETKIKVSSKEGKDRIETKVNIIKNLAVFLPKNLTINTRVRTHEKKRGIFSVPVYESVIDMSGNFATPETARIKRDIDEFIWEDAVLVYMMSDVAAIKQNITLNINNGATKSQFRSGMIHPANTNVQGIHVPVSAEYAKGEFRFSLQIHLNGSSGLFFTPVSAATKSTMQSDWPHPSFQGRYLPKTHKISANGFTADWFVPATARQLPQQMHVSTLNNFMGRSVFGLNFYQPTGYYNLITRSLKYAIGFIAIAFFAVFILEVQSQKRVHWVQYIFVGLALTVFYVVLLGVSEHIGFAKSYAISSLATSILISIYVGLALQSLRRSLIIFGILTASYGLLYLLLKAEDYALLIGSIATFVVLTIVMFSTRKVNWSGTPQEKPEGEVV